MPAVSVIMAAYNHGAFIPAAIESVLAQTMPDLELLVVDDGSTDATPDAVRPYLADPRVRYFRQENRGQAAAKNHGIARSTGDFVAFLDADDVWLPRKLERQLPLFDAPRVGVVHSQREVIDARGKIRPTPRRKLPHGDVLNQLFVDNFVCFSSAVVRRTCFEARGVFDERFRVGIDYELWLRMAAKFLFRHVDEPLTLYRTGHGQLSDRKDERLATAFSIMNHCLGNPEIRARLDPGAIRRAYAMTHASTAHHLLARGETRQARASLYASLRYLPCQLTAYKLLARSFSPGWCVAIWHVLRGNEPQRQ